MLGNTSTYKHTENDKADARAKTHMYTHTDTIKKQARLYILLYRREMNV